MPDRLEPGDTPMNDALKLYKYAIRHWDLSLRHTGTIPTEVVEHVYARALLIMRSYCLPQNWPNGDKEAPREYLPPSLIHSVAEQLAYILAGQLPDPIRQLTGRGVPGTGPEESRDIALAVAYITLAKDGQLNDPHPVQTICSLYDVTDSTVRKWQRKLTHIKPSDFFPDAEPEARVALISDAVQRWGARYRAAGHNRIQRKHKSRASSV